MEKHVIWKYEIEVSDDHTLIIPAHNFDLYWFIPIYLWFRGVRI